jgi:hypothetical protein
MAEAWSICASSERERHAIMKRKVSISLILCFVIQITQHVAPIQADLIAHEDFESYAAGDLDANGSADNGWTDGWERTYGSNYSVVEQGLFYSNGDITINGGNRSVLAIDDSSTINRSFEATSNDEIYFSFLFANPVAGFNSTLIGGHLSDNATPTTTYAAIGKMATPEFSVRINAGGFDGVASTTTIGTNETYFLVGRVSKDGTDGDMDDHYDRVELWINPSSLTPGGPQVTMNNSMGVGSNITHFIFRMNTSAATMEYQMDEVRVGTSFGAVIPEPGSALLVLFGMLLMAHRKRRFRAG